MIYIENKKKYKGVGVYIGRPSILGNPFTHLAGNTLAKFVVESRDESIKRYRNYFIEKIISDSIFRKEVDSLKKLHDDWGDIHLVCWCKPLSCHGDIIKEYLEKGMLL